MKDSQQNDRYEWTDGKYIKANNERFSTAFRLRGLSHKYIKANNERFSTGLARCRALL